MANNQSQSSQSSWWENWWEDSTAASQQGSWDNSRETGEAGATFGQQSWWYESGEGETGDNAGEDWDWDQVWSRGWDEEHGHPAWDESQGGADGARADTPSKAAAVRGKGKGKNKPGRGCRAKRREERGEQLHRNSLRRAMLQPVASAPLQVQIKHEQLVKARVEMNERLLPGLLDEAEGFAKAQQAFKRLVQEPSLLRGRDVSMVPPPVAPWIPPTSPPPANLAGAPRDSSGRVVPKIPPPRVSSGFVPKTPPTPPHGMR
jgi:hypothetical protein